MKKHMKSKNPLMSSVMESLVSLPTPSAISYLWNMGFLLGMTLMLQIATGLTLAMSYIPSTELAFESVIHIMRDTQAGWVMRYMHANGASLFFMLIYIHMARGVYFDSARRMPTVWASGVMILLVSMGAAFLGYVLPWGQMSFWGATVITSMISALPYNGLEMTEWLWGNYSVSQPTLNRFFSLHFLVPLVLTALVMIHLILLHQTGSSNPMGMETQLDKMKFFPYFATKDMTPLVMIMMMMTMMMTMSPDILGDVENYNQASTTTTPTHIQPEWYFLFAYAILRAIPSKLGGVMAMVMAIMIMMTLSIKHNSMNKKFSPLMKLTFWYFVATVLMLTWLGANPVEPPFTTMGQLNTITYFTLVMLM